MIFNGGGANKRKDALNFRVLDIGKGFKLKGRKANTLRCKVKMNQVGEEIFSD